MRSPTLQSIAVFTILGFVTAAKLPHMRTANHIVKDTINLDSNYRTNSFRKRDWVKIAINPPKLVHTTLGERVEFECEVSGSPPPTIHWLHGSSRLQNEDIESNHILDNMVTPGGLAKVKARLVIDCVMPQHEGLYRCVATAGGQTAEADPTMVLIQGNHVNNITALLSACPDIANIHAEHTPHILQWSILTMENIGNDVTLPCRASGNPTPAIYWLNGDNELVSENDARIKVLPSGDLMIFNLSWDDMGGYTCVARNHVGHDTEASFIYPLLKDNS